MGFANIAGKTGLIYSNSAQSKEETVTFIGNKISRGDFVCQVNKVASTNTLAQTSPFSNSSTICYAKLRDCIVKFSIGPIEYTSYQHGSNTGYDFRDNVYMFLGVTYCCYPINNGTVNWSKKTSDSVFYIGPITTTSTRCVFNRCYFKTHSVSLLDDHTIILPVEFQAEIAEERSSRVAWSYWSFSIASKISLSFSDGVLSNASVIDKTVTSMYDSDYREDRRSRFYGTPLKLCNTQKIDSNTSLLSTAIWKYDASKYNYLKFGSTYATGNSTVTLPLFYEFISDDTNEYIKSKKIAAACKSSNSIYVISKSSTLEGIWDRSGTRYSSATITDIKTVLYKNGTEIFSSQYVYDGYSMCHLSTVGTTDYVLCAFQSNGYAKYEILKITGNNVSVNSQKSEISQTEFITLKKIDDYHYLSFGYSNNENVPSEVKLVQVGNSNNIASIVSLSLPQNFRFAKAEEDSITISDSVYYVDQYSDPYKYNAILIVDYTTGSFITLGFSTKVRFLNDAAPVTGYASLSLQTKKFEGCYAKYNESTMPISIVKGISKSSGVNGSQIKIMRLKEVSE